MGRAAVILLDTHVWVRWLAPTFRLLAVNVLASIEAADRLAVSATSCWEVLLPHKRRCIDLRHEPKHTLRPASAGLDKQLHMVLNERGVAP